MSQANIDISERLVAAINAREISDEVAKELLAPDFRLRDTSTAVTDKTYDGAEGLREYVSDVLAVFDEDTHFEPKEILAVGEDFVVGRLRLVGHGAKSGAPVSVSFAQVAWWCGEVSRHSVSGGSRPCCRSMPRMSSGTWVPTGLRTPPTVDMTAFAG